MFLKRKQKKRVCAAIDIGTYSVKMLEATISQEECLLSKYSIKELPENPSLGIISGTIKTAIEKSKITARDVHIALSGPNVIVRFIEMPKMALPDLKNSLKYEADRFIPFNIDEVYIDASILGNAKEGSGNMRVLLAVAKKDLVDSRIELLTKLGFTVTLIDITAFTLFNALLYSDPAIKDETGIAILNLGHKYTNVVIGSGNDPGFTRDIQIGSDHITKIVSKQTGVSAEKVFSTATGPDGASIQDSLKTALGKLGDELRLSFGYFENHFGKPINKIYVSGGLIHKKPVLHFIEKSFGITPIIWDPFRKFSIDAGIDKDQLDSVRSSLAVACGLVVRAGTT